jgi:hypothetical protein
MARRIAIMKRKIEIRLVITMCLLSELEWLDDVPELRI